MDLVALKEAFDVVQLIREEIAREFLLPKTNLHRGFVDVGYEEREAIVIEYGVNYRNIEQILAGSYEKTKYLPIVIPAEFVPGSTAASVLKALNPRDYEVYAVYSLKT